MSKSICLNTSNLPRHLTFVSTFIMYTLAHKSVEILELLLLWVGEGGFLKGILDIKY